MDSIQATQKSQKNTFDAEVIRMLEKLADARVTQLTPGRLDTFLPRLRKYGLRDISYGIEVLAETARMPGETAFPDLATVVRAIEDARRRRATPKGKFVGCNACSNTDGYIVTQVGTHSESTRCACWHEWRASAA